MLPLHACLREVRAHHFHLRPLRLLPLQRGGEASSHEGEAEAAARETRLLELSEALQAEIAKLLKKDLEQTKGIIFKELLNNEKDLLSDLLVF